MKQTLTRILRNRWFLIGGGLLVAYALFGFLLLPWLVQRYVPEYARDSLQRQASIGKVRVNPFLFTFEVNELRLAESDGTPVVGVRHLFVDFETISLLRWAWVFANIDIDGRYQAAVEGEALRSEKVRRELTAEQKVTLAPGEEPGAAEFEKKAGRKASRVNPALALFGKGSEDREFYEALYRRLVELPPLPAAELQALGEQRASAVSQALVKDAGIDAARVALGKTEAAAEAPQDTIETKLRLDVLGAKP